MRLITWIKGIVSGKKRAKALVLLRGVPGSGKSTMAETLSEGKYPVLAADDYFMVDGEYKWDRTKLGRAHKDCQERCRRAMEAGERLIFVNNTFIKVRDMKEYIDMAQEHGYMVFSVIVENRHGGKDVHGVPEETLEKMAAELMNSIRLR